MNIIDNNKEKFVSGILELSSADKRELCEVLLRFILMIHTEQIGCLELIQQFIKIFQDSCIKSHDTNQLDETNHNYNCHKKTWMEALIIKHIIMKKLILRTKNDHNDFVDTIKQLCFKNNVECNIIKDIIKDIIKEHVN